MQYLSQSNLLKAEIGSAPVPQIKQSREYVKQPDQSGAAGMAMYSQGL